MSLRQVLGFLLIFTASVLPCMAQMRPTARSTFSIAGSIHDDNGQQTMENVRVDLKESTGIPLNTTFTRAGGEFEFDGLTRGDYIIQVAVKDYETLEQKVSIAGADVRGLYISLARATSVVNQNSGASISAHELSVPGKAHEEYLKGMNLMYGKSDYRGAIVQFEHAIKDFQTFYEAYAQEGNAYFLLGETASAEQALRKSVELSSGQYSYALFILSGLLTEAKQYPEAVTFATKGIAVDGASWHGPFELARALLGLGQVEEAEKNAVQARDMNPKNPLIYLLLANIFIARREYPALLNDLDAYLKLVPSGPEADRARATRDNLQAIMQQEESQARADAAHPPHPEAQNSRVAGNTSSSPAEQPPPPPDPDLSGLPSLPPPGSRN
jgi:tetratricopeptide (TPR) repeat protein